MNHGIWITWTVVLAVYIYDMVYVWMNFTSISTINTDPLNIRVPALNEFGVSYMTTINVNNWILNAPCEYATSDNETCQLIFLMPLSYEDLVSTLTGKWKNGDQIRRDKEDNTFIMMGALALSFSTGSLLLIFIESFRTRRFRKYRLVQLLCNLMVLAMLIVLLVHFNTIRDKDCALARDTSISEALTIIQAISPPDRMCKPRSHSENGLGQFGPCVVTIATQTYSDLTRLIQDFKIEMDTIGTPWLELILSILISAVPVLIVLVLSMKSSRYDRDKRSEMDQDDLLDEKEERQVQFSTLDATKPVNQPPANRRPYVELHPPLSNSDELTEGTVATAPEDTTYI